VTVSLFAPVAVALFVGGGGEYAFLYPDDDILGVGCDEKNGNLYSVS
jgi:hypothetical protein